MGGEGETPPPAGGGLVGDGDAKTSFGFLNTMRTRDSWNFEQKSKNVRAARAQS